MARVMARYADLDKVLELVNEVNEDGNFTSYAHYSYLFDSIDNLPTIEQPYWIPCSKRRPNNEDFVIVTILDERGDTAFRYSDFGWYLNKAGCWIVDAEVRTDVIAWMPLPKPYGGDTK